MTDKLTDFLARNYACREGLDRLAATGATTPEEAFERADARDLIWAVTRPGVMSFDQRRRFLAEAVLAPIEGLLTDERSLNILRKLRTNEQITQEDKDAAYAAYAARAAAMAVTALAAAEAAARAVAAYAAAYAAYAARAAARAVAAYAAAYAAYDAYDAAREAQARWIRENLKLESLHTN